jgi:hypothetical protein
VGKGDDLTAFIVPKVEKIQSLNLPDPQGPTQDCSGKTFITSKRMRWAGHGLYVGGKGKQQHTGLQNLRERNHLEDLGVDGIIILKWIFKNRFGRAWTELIWLRTGASGVLMQVRCPAFELNKKSAFP